jgi:uncharacterized protein DUF4249
MLMGRSFGVVAAVVLAACRNLEAPAASQQTRLVVHGVLDLTAEVQTVLVYRARTGLPDTVDATHMSDDEPVADAQVRITAPDGTIAAAARPGKTSGGCCEPGIYVFERAPVGSLTLTPGGTYTLRIRTPLGEEVTGTTTIPKGPSALAVPSAHVFFRLRDTLRLSWQRVPQAASYEIIIRMPQFGDEYRTFADTSFAIAGTALTIAGDEIFQSGEDVEVFVSAVDVSYYDYYRSQSDPFAGGAPSHLAGAVGLFGSIAPIFHTVLQVR